METSAGVISKLENLQPHFWFVKWFEGVFANFLIVV